MIGDQKVNDIRLLFERQDRAVTHQNNNSIFVGNNHTQDLQDTSGSIKDNIIKTNNILRNNSIREKYSANFFDSLAQVHGVKKVSKSTNDATKSSTSQTEKTDIPNKILSNDTDNKISGILMPPPPPPPPPPLLLPYSTNYTMQRSHSTTNGDNNLSTSTLSTLQKKAKSNTSTGIKIDTPMQIKIHAKAGVPIVIEISVPVDTEIEVKTNTRIPCIQSTNEDITADNCYTDSSGSDSGHDTLSGSASDLSCCGKIW